MTFSVVYDGEVNGYVSKCDGSSLGVSRDSKASYAQTQRNFRREHTVSGYYANFMLIFSP